MTKSRHNCWICNLGLTYSLAISGVINPISLFLLVTSHKNSVLAQIVPDQTLGGESSVVNPNADIKGITSDQIEGGAIRGTNLFHSFEEFSIREGQGAYFINSTGIERIFGRVTGSNISQIFGKLGVLGNADLFLINPNGIVFGSDAVLDLNGSFLATTANSLAFEDGTQFSATDTSTLPLLTISIPIGLQFGETSGSILNQSQFGLEVQPEKTLALVGGNVTMEGGNIIAPRARIELGSVAGTGLVRFREIDSGWALSYEGIQNFQDIELTQSPTPNNELFLEGISLLTIFSPDGRGGGSIQVHGRNVTLSNGSQIAGSGGNLTLFASDTVQVSGTSSGIPSAIASEAPLTGKESSLTINTKKLIVQDGGLLTSEALGFFDEEEGLTTTKLPGGDLIVNASESVELRGNGESSTGLFSRTQGFGAAGDIKINTQKLIVSDRAVISAESAGEDLLGQPLATGQAGNIDIIASEFVELNDGSISSETRGFGDDAGNVTVETEQMAVFNEAEITVSNLQGQAGNLTINADSLFLNQGSITAETGTTGGEAGANINLEIADLLRLENESLISATANGLADGGNINIDADFVIAVPNQNNDIIAKAARGDGGNINITTNALFGIAERSSLPANNTNDIDASSEFGLDGTVAINELDVNPAEELEELPAEVIDATRLVDQNLCQQGDRSEFIVTGKGGIAPNPSQARDGEVSEVDLVEPATVGAGEQGSGGAEEAEAQRSRGAEEEIIEAQGWMVNDRGILELVAHKTSLNDSAPQSSVTCD